MGSISIIVIAIVAGIVAISIGFFVQDYMIEKEKIKAEMALRAEEVRAKNQLEIERLIHGTNKSAASAREQLDDKSLDEQGSIGLDKREVKEKLR